MIFLVISLATLFFYLPILINPGIFLERGSDLEEFFWPIIYFVKQQVLENHTFPLWNNLFFSGTPLLPDPQSPLFYPLNIVFLLMPIGAGFIASFVLHTIIGGVGVYFAAKEALNLSKKASLFSALLYTTTPKLAGYLEAGHFGLATSLAWLPFIVLATIKLAKNPRIVWSITLALSLAGTFFTHPVNFAIASFSSSILFIATIFFIKTRAKLLSNFLYFATGILLTFGFVSVALLPQLMWLPQATRLLLLDNPDVYPKWQSIKEFLLVTITPWINGLDNLQTIDTEKWLTLGLGTSIFALIGFMQLKKVAKIAILSTGLVITLVALNNASPVYQFLLSQDWYVLFRVSTRIWILPILAFPLLAGVGFDKLTKNVKKIVPFLVVAAIGENILISWAYLNKPINDKSRLAPEAVYQYLAEDKDMFRVFCVNRCLSQKKVAEYNLETVEGYGTLQQKNYYNQFIQLSQVFWDRYTLALPPFEIYNFREIQPYAPELADYNIKYVISPHKLEDARLVREITIGDYTIYKNTINKSRAFFTNGDPAPIIKYSPNEIIIDTSSKTDNILILSEVYSPGWKAYLNGKEEVPIQETSQALRSVEINGNTKFIDFKYKPKSFTLGRTITSLAILLSVILAIKNYLTLIHRSV